MSPQQHTNKQELPEQKPSIVIIGGGIIGCTTAYYLSQRSVARGSESGYQKITLLEASKHGVAQGASGKAGGLVAKWAYPKELVNVSFREHVKLAERLDGKTRWGWRYVDCGSWEGKGEELEGDVDEIAEKEDEGRKGKKVKRRSLEKKLGLGDGAGKDNAKIRRREAGLPDDLTWVKEELTTEYSPMAPSGHTAQVYPYEFTSSMLDLARSNGVEFVAGRATSIKMIDGHTADGLGHPRVSGVEYHDLATGTTKVLQCSHVILAAGAWSPTLLLPKHRLPISPTRAHSIVLQPEEDVTISPYVLFTDIKLPPGPDGRLTDASPEIYARPNNQVYACGPGDDSPLPDTVDDVDVDREACDSVQRHVSSISKQLRRAKVDKRQACFLPYVTQGGGPIVGEATKIAKGLIIATGHTCWGICNAPGTAKAIAELVDHGEIRCADLRNLHPSRFL